MDKKQFKNMVAKMNIGETIRVGGDGLITLVSLVNIYDDTAYIVGGYATGVKAFPIYEGLCDDNAEEINKLVDYTFSLLDVDGIEVLDRLNNKFKIS